MQHPNHPDHDLLLIAAHAAGDLAGTERTQVQARLDACGPCADLHRDLVAIATATRALPHVATAPRDFRLSQEQAAKLRRGSWLRTVLGPLAGARSAARPIAAGLTSLGVAGLLIATFLPGMLGAAGSPGGARDLSVTRTEASAAPAAAPGATAATNPELQPVAGAPTADAGGEFGAKDGLTASAAPGVAIAGGATQGTRATTDTASTPGVINLPSPLFVGSLALFVVGLLLFGLRFAARRLR